MRSRSALAHDGKSGTRSVFPWFIGATVFLFLATVVFGLDFVLNAISTSFVIGVGVVLAVGVLASLTALAGLVVRDAIEEIRSDREEGRPWLWRCIGWAGILGILVDGAIGAWNVYQQHIVFGKAVEAIPLAGVPVLLALASYPFKWVEALLMKRRENDRHAALRGGADDGLDEPE